MKKIDLTLSKKTDANALLSKYDKPDSFYSDLLGEIEKLKQAYDDKRKHIELDVKLNKLKKDEGTKKKAALKKKFEANRNALRENLHHPYKDFSESIDSYNFTKLLNVTACPYCNMNDITTCWSLSNGKVCRPDLDHFQPQSRYPSLQLKLDNLVPCCLACNRTIKGQKEFSRFTHFNPYLDDFDDVMEFDLVSSNDCFDNDDDFEISIVPKQSKKNTDEANRANANVRDFELISRYKSKTSKRLVKTIMKNKKLWSKMQKREIGDISDMANEIEQSLFENEFCEINNTIYGKLCRDIIRIYVRGK